MHKNKIDIFLLQDVPMGVSPSYGIIISNQSLVLQVSSRQFIVPQEGL